MHAPATCCGSGAAENGADSDGGGGGGGAGAAPTAATPQRPIEQPAVTRAHGGHQRIVYISDIAGLPAHTRAYLLRAPIDLFVLDALSRQPYPTHFSLKQAVACALDVRPVGRTVFVGMNHRVDYHAEAPRLAAFGASRGGLALELGWDGWSAFFELTRVGSVGSVAADMATAAAAAAAGGCGPHLFTYADAALPEWDAEEEVKAQPGPTV